MLSDSLETCGANVDANVEFRAVRSSCVLFYIANVLNAVKTDEFSLSYQDSRLLKTTNVC